MFVGARAAQLLALKPDVIVVSAGEAAARAVKDLTSTTPIVIVDVGDPVGMRLVTSLAHPGGNVTGMASLQVDLVPKRLEPLKATLPRTGRVALLLPPRGAVGATWLPANVEHRAAAASALGVTLVPVEIESPAAFDAAAAKILEARPDAILVGAHPITNAIGAKVAEFGLQKRIPVIACCRAMSSAGVLISYGANVPDQFRNAAVFAAKILKGAKPADLPVEQPTKFELIINLKTAAAIGIKIPQTVLERADEVIQ